MKPPFIKTDWVVQEGGFEFQEYTYAQGDPGHYKKFLLGWRRLSDGPNGRSLIKSYPELRKDLADQVFGGVVQKVASRWLANEQGKSSLGQAEIGSDEKEEALEEETAISPASQVPVATLPQKRNSYKNNSREIAKLWSHVHEIEDAAEEMSRQIIKLGRRVVELENRGSN